MYSILRPLLFALPPEAAHHVTLSALKAAESVGLAGLVAPNAAKTKSTPVKLMGLEFPNAVGLAAGLDKNAEYIQGLAAMGFGFIEVGTVTPRPQPGNPKPRMFRLKAERGLINRMGFNNHGLDYFLAQVERAQYDGILGINIGKNFDTPVESAVDDYRLCLQRVYAHADYITVNISSPNTPGLRTLQYGEQLHALLSELRDTQQSLQSQHQKTVPIVLKVAPDLSEGEVESIAEQLLACEMDGVIATNTTSGRVGVEANPLAEQAGGLSGAPLTTLSTQAMRGFVQALEGKIPVIGVGGIMCGDDAAEKIRNGAALVQLYTGLIYRGPGLVSECVQAIARLKNH